MLKIKSKYEFACKPSHRHAFKLNHTQKKIFNFRFILKTGHSATTHVSYHGYHLHSSTARIFFYFTSSFQYFHSPVEIKTLSHNSLKQILWLRIQITLTFFFCSYNLYKVIYIFELFPVFLNSVWGNRTLYKISGTDNA